MSDDKAFGLPKVYACVNSDEKIRDRSSSGGVFFLLACYVLENGGFVFGAGFDDNFNVVHKCVSNVDDLYDIMTSKYVQSSVKDAYSRVYELLKEEKKVLFTGTPCQILGLNSYLSIKDGGKMRDDPNLLMMEIMCFGVPSPMVWRRYLDDLSKGRRIKNVSFRKKINGSGVKNLLIDFGDEQYISNYKDDKYYKAFSDALSLRKSCYECDAKKSKRPSDIILGDFWGIESINTKLDCEKGVSAVVVKTAKGLNAFENISDHLIYEEYGLGDVLKQNIYYKKSVPYNSGRSHFFEYYK